MARTRHWAIAVSANGYIADRLELEVDSSDRDIGCGSYRTVLLYRLLY